MDGLAFNFQPYTSTPEDGWFRWIVIASVILHGLFLLGFNGGTPKIQTTATHGAIKVSLNLLKQQTDSRAVDEKKHKQTPHKKPVPVVKKNNTAKSKEKTNPPIAVKQKNQSASKQKNIARAPVLAAKVIRGSKDQTLIAEQRYLSMLLTHVEGFKFYPPLARRRGIEGNIDVSFRLLRSGEIRRLKVSNGPLILRQAAEHAIHAAMPMPVPPTEVATPKQLSFVMAYQLN